MLCPHTFISYVSFESFFVRTYIFDDTFVILICNYDGLWGEGRFRLIEVIAV